MKTLLANKKKFNTLDKTWKELIFAFAGFGPNFLMVMLGAYFQNAVNPSALGPTAIATQSIGNICIVLPGLFSVLWFIAKCFDGIIDIPFANLTDSLRTKFGNRRIPIAISFVPMVVAYGLLWFPILGIQQNSVGNTIWFFAWALIFFASYTMGLITYYGSFSTVCSSEGQKARVSSYKSFFDTISYALVYALVPVILGSANLRINKFVLYCLPLMLTMIIPLFMIKEGDKWAARATAAGYDVTPSYKQTKVKLFESLKLTSKNKPFLKWLAINACSFFGLQLFLVSMNALESGAMGLNSTQMTIANTCAFAPVPLMLYIFNKLKANNGTRFAFQVALMSFAIAILGFLFGSKFFFPDNVNVRLIIACVSGVIGSFGTGSFFMMGYLIPSQIASVEEVLTKKNHASMYFAVQAVTTSVVGALSSSVVWENIKNLFFARGYKGVVTASDITKAAEKIGIDASGVTNLGTFIVPMIICLMCVIGFIIAFKMPKVYSHENIGIEIIGEKKYLKNIKQYPATPKVKPEVESLIVFDALWILSASIFGYIWCYSLLSINNHFKNNKISKLWLILVIFFPPFYAYVCYRLNKQMNLKMDSLKIKHKKLNALVIIFSILCLSCVPLSIIQHKANEIILTMEAKNE